jgi:hypothetical protein
MKKILSILLPGLLWCNFGFAYDTHPNDFTNWLFKNGYSEYVEEINVCKVEKKYSKKWFDFRCENRPNGVFVKKNKLKIEFYKDRSNIPWNAKPNYDTLLYYLFSYIKRVDSGKYWETEGSKNPYIFESDLREDKYIDKQLKKTALVSYLLFENDKITIDKKSPKDRFGILVQDDTKLISMSVGKSMVSYVLGHAICGGYIDNVNSKIDDWPLIKNTLYDGQSILDLINMSAGDQQYINVTERIKKTKKSAGSASIKYHMESVFYGSKKSKPKWNYNGLVPHLILNYIWFKSDGDYQKILDETFKEKSRIKDSVLFREVKGDNYNDGLLVNSFHASRYDYLRIARAMLDDWQNDTCVGKYLKTIYKNKVKKNDKWKDEKSSWFNPKGYAGFFHTDYSGMNGRAVMGMDGYGGQSMIIDFDLGRIIIINSIHTNYNWKKIAHSVIKKGK